jgi:hypothetical protein
LELILSNVQDVVIEHLGRGWPSRSVDTRAFEGGDQLPLPRAAFHNMSVHVWFALGDETVLEIADIPFREGDSGSKSET